MSTNSPRYESKPSIFDRLASITSEQSKTDTSANSKLESENQLTEVNVHFVPHSHMDAGWLHTYDQYYERSVQHIFDSVFDKLAEDSNYRYTVGDIAYFRRYFRAQTKG